MCHPIWSEPAIRVVVRCGHVLGQTSAVLSCKLQPRMTGHDMLPSSRPCQWSDPNRPLQPLGTLGQAAKIVLFDVVASVAAEVIAPYHLPSSQCYRFCPEAIPAVQSTQPSSGVEMTMGR